MRVSIVIQGPLNPISIGNISRYKKFGEVIVSHWSNDDASILNGINDIKIVSNEPVAIDLGKISNPQNLYRQAITTLNGMKNAVGDIVVKTRSDEYYGNLSPFLTAMLRNPGKVACGNIYFRKGWVRHICDHVLCGSRELLVKTYDSIKRKCEKFVDETGKITTDRPVYRRAIPEVVLTTSILEAKGEQVQDMHAKRPHKPDERAQMLRNFVLIPIRDCTPFLAKIQHPGGRHIYIDKEDHQLMNYNGDCIYNAIDEL